MGNNKSVSQAAKCAILNKCSKNSYEPNQEKEYFMEPGSVNILAIVFGILGGLLILVFLLSRSTKRYDHLVLQILLICLFISTILSNFTSVFHN